MDSANTEAEVVVELHRPPDDENHVDAKAAQSRHHSGSGSDHDSTYSSGDGSCSAEDGSAKRESSSGSSSPAIVAEDAAAADAGRRDNVVDHHGGRQRRKATATGRKNLAKFFRKLGLKSAGNDIAPSLSPPISLSLTTGSPKETEAEEEKLENVKVDSLPQAFFVRYLGQRSTKGLWGIKHTRGPVEELISATRKMNPNDTLPVLRLDVGQEGVGCTHVEGGGGGQVEEGLRPIDTISYGVQDVKYTRVFAMIAVKEDTTFECHAYVCTSRVAARKLAYSLALAFKEYGKQCNGRQQQDGLSLATLGGAGGDQQMDVAGGGGRQKFAIDLRTPSEIEADLEMDSEA